MIAVTWIVSLVIAYALGRRSVVIARKKAKEQWAVDSYDETPIGTQLAKEMGIEL